MHSALIFAILSLLSAGLNDVVFKRYSRKIRSRGMYIFGVGIVWAILQSATFFIKGDVNPHHMPSILFGLTAGLFLVLSNILLLESMTHIDISICSTIYRLNTIGVVILSFLILDESINIIKISGILLGILAVMLLFQKKHHSAGDFNFSLFFGLSIFASGLRALYGVTSKGALMNNANPDLMLLIVSFCWIAGGFLYAAFKENRILFTSKKALYSLVSGVLVFLIVNFLMLALEYGEASVVIPIANMSFIMALVVSVTLKMEKLTIWKIAAVLSAVISIVCLSKA
jgi:drug/metabolite transporter (DMT)-like permease